MLSIFKRIFGGGELDCEEVRRHSSEYLEEDLPAAKQSAIRMHLSKCGPCKAFVETLASTIGLLSRLPRVSAPPGLKQTLIDRTVGDRDKNTS
jgi:predicted anti-sigma-YlaC factor YlaD